MSHYVLSIDQGTTGTTALVIDTDDNMRVIGRCTVDFPQYYPKPGWVEHDLDEIWASVGKAVEGALAKASQLGENFNSKSIACIGITNQRETLCAFEKDTGRPLAKAIVWQCRRTTNICKEIKSSGHEKMIREKTGLVVDPYFSGTKLRWYMENDNAVAQGVKDGRVLFGTIDTYVLYRLTGGHAFKTEPSNASRTMVFNLATGDYDDELLQIMKVPSRQVLPQIVDSAGEFGKTSGCGFIADGIPITGILGDQQAALAGQTCFGKGDAKCTYGTGAFILLNTGTDRLVSSAGLITTVAWSIKNQLTYAFEGSAFIAGAAVQFIRDQLKFIDASPDSETLAKDKKAAPEVYFVPALTGLGAPIWDPEARGAFLGLTRGTDVGQLARATLEGVALQVVDLIDAMERDFPGAIVDLKVDGGACANNILMQAQADFSGLTVDRPRNLETTAFGAALFAGLGAGLYKSLDDLKNLRESERKFHPGSEEIVERKAVLAGWKRALKAVRAFSDAEENT